MAHNSGQYTFGMSQDELEKLAIIAEQLECHTKHNWRGNPIPSVPALIRAVANGTLKVSRNTRR